MAREVINVGAAPNDGTGDPIRTAYIKCNNNFGELYSRAQVNPPASLIGTVGDQAGMYAYDADYFYYCYQDYDGSSTIWAEIPNTVIDAFEIANGNSNVSIPAVGGNIQVSVGGVANTVVFASSGTVINGDLNVTGNATLSGNIVGDRIINGTTSIEIPTAGGNANVTVAGVSDIAVFATTGVFFTGEISATGNSAAANFNTPGLISASGNITSGNIATSGLISVAGNITGGNIITVGTITATGNIDTNGGINAVGNVDVGNLNAVNRVFTLGNIRGGNVGAFGLMIADGNLEAANVISNGSISAGTSVSATGNITGNIILSNTYTKTIAVLVTNLPSAITVGAGARAFVTDSTDIIFAANVAGGGGNAVPVFSDGTVWKIG